MSAETAKEKQIPLILIAISIALYVVAAFAHAGASGAAQTLIVVLVGAVIQTAVLIAAAFLVAFMFSVSFGEVRTAILKFAAACLTAGAIGAIIPLAGLISLVVFLGLIVWLFEIEMVYAIALAIINWVITIAVLLVLRSAA